MTLFIQQATSAAMEM